MSVEDIARDIGATPPHKRTEVSTKTELGKESRQSVPQYRRVAEDVEFIMPPSAPPPAVLITDSLSPVNDHEYCTNCNQKGHIKIMGPFHVKKTCSKCGQPDHNIISCGRPPKKAVKPQDLTPLPDDTPATPGTSNLHLIYAGKGANFYSQPTLDNFQRLTHDQPCELCKGYDDQTKNCYITYRNSRNSFQSTNQ